MNGLDYPLLNAREGLKSAKDLILALEATTMSAIDDKGKLEELQKRGKYGTELTINFAGIIFPATKEAIRKYHVDDIKSIIDFYKRSGEEIDERTALEITCAQHMAVVTTKELVSCFSESDRDYLNKKRSDILAIWPNYDKIYKELDKSSS